MKQGQAKVVHLKEYQVANYLAETVYLNVDLNDAETIVTSTVKYQRHREQPQASTLRLNGEAQELISVSIDGNTLPESAYELDDEHLSLSDLPEAFELQVTSRITRKIILHLKDSISRVETTVLSVKQKDLGRSLIS